MGSSSMKVMGFYRVTAKKLFASPVPHPFLLSKTVNTNQKSTDEENKTEIL